MITITVCNAKGGVAKTTTALSLASFLASNKKKTLLLDIDPQANATKTFLELNIGDIASSPTMFDVFYSYVMERKKNLIKESVRQLPVSDFLYMVPATLRMEQFKDVIKSHSKRPIEVLKEIVKPIQKDFDYLIIDCPADLSIYVENAIEIADYVLCPSIYDFYGIDGLSLVIPTISEIKGEDFGDYAVLYTMFNPRATKVQEKLKDYANMLEEMNKVLPFRIPVDQNIKNSQADSVDFMTDKTYSNSKARLAYQDLGNYVLENWN
jgi:chromosome partitioning protein